MQQNVKIFDIIELEIKRMGINGEGIGYYQKLAIFVEGALPGEKILAQITEVFENRAIAKVLKILVQSENRTTPFCPVFDECGGCQTQHFNYSAMLKQKKDILIKSFDRYYKNYDKQIFAEPIGMEDPMHYRNKASLPFKKIDGKNQFGMFARNSNRFIAIEDCGVQHQKINEVFKTITELMDRYQLDAYDFESKTGFISHGVVRISENLDEIQVSFIVPERVVEIGYIVDDLIQLHPEIVSVFEIVNNDTKKDTFYTNESYLLFGKRTISEALDGNNYMLTPDTFFQLNTTQADKFYKKMVELADLKPNEIAIDAFAGVAPVSHYVYKYAKKVYAIEINKETSDTAKEALNFNNVTNVEVINSSFKQSTNLLMNENIDVIFFDPPRLGLGFDGIDMVKKLFPTRIVYGSCNPSTLAKDINELKDLYDIKTIVPVDMFPFTSLVESITLLEKKN
ncbi:23S rRNA (uracil(1939)-C(5))-methyltransferase RlmD [Acholeplasma hippikon]|uniref:tRNA (Uracil-5-)-methyltransferase related enzyme n=1 Tax=Acholeplasma hippikon TaxID=264636 RepID=A0A449BIF0_9MOLU|nr:23S rRNA (uracil(1939)-C(5))-methyltransferase RlmD [Acholeplasma hippikon]VEU82236.1 tRNA (uracil-5-)-methyltransferase related enzyme [Acholeplasma hippikon]